MKDLGKILPSPVCPVDGTKIQLVGLQIGEGYTLMMLSGRWCPSCKGYVVNLGIIQDPETAAQGYAGVYPASARKLREEGFKFNF